MTMEILDINLRHNIDQEGSLWILRILNLAVPHGITTSLSRPEGRYTCGPILMLDWHDILVTPTQARLHFPAGGLDERSASTRDKLKIIKEALRGILTYHSIMTERQPGTTEEAREMLIHCQLPTLSEVVLDSSNPSLRRHLSSLGFIEDPNLPHPLQGPWTTLVRIAQSHPLFNRFS